MMCNREEALPLRDKKKAGTQRETGLSEEEDTCSVVEEKIDADTSRVTELVKERQQHFSMMALTSTIK